MLGIKRRIRNDKLNNFNSFFYLKQYKQNYKNKNKKIIKKTQF